MGLAMEATVADEDAELDNEVVDEIDRPKGAVPHRLPVATEDLFITDFAKRCGIPVEAAKGGAETMYPEYRSKLPGTPATCVAAPR